MEIVVGTTPQILGAIIVLMIGWAAGRALGRGASKVLDKVGVDDALRKTPIGRAIERSGITIVRFFDLITRWFVYLIAILAAVNILEIAILSGFMASVVSYLPSFIAGVFILLIGFIIADFVSDSLAAVGREAKIEYYGLLSTLARFTFYFVILIVGLSTMRIDVSILNTFATAFAWGFAGAIAIGLGLAVGLGLKDIVNKRAESWFGRAIEVAKEVEPLSESKRER